MSAKPADLFTTTYLDTGTLRTCDLCGHEELPCGKGQVASNKARHQMFVHLRTEHSEEVFLLKLRKPMSDTTLTQARLHEVVHYDPKTGIFTRIKCGPGAKLGVIKGTNLKGYLAAGIDGQKVLLHRLAWLYMTGKFPDQTIDHIDGNRTNNAFSNLRDVSIAVNNENRRVPFPMNNTGFLGVSQPYPGAFTAHVRVRGLKKHLGTFANPKDAHSAYLRAKNIYHEGNTLPLPQEAST